MPRTVYFVWVRKWDGIRTVYLRVSEVSVTQTAPVVPESQYPVLPVVPPGTTPWLTAVTITFTSAGLLFRTGQISCSFLHRFNSNIYTCILLNVFYEFQVFFCDYCVQQKVDKRSSASHLSHFPKDTVDFETSIPVTRPQFPCHSPLERHALYCQYTANTMFILTSRFLYLIINNTIMGGNLYSYTQAGMTRAQRPLIVTSYFTLHIINTKPLYHI